MTWGEYIELALKRINDIHAKSILLHISKHRDRDWTPSELKEALGLNLNLNQIKERLRILVKADFIKEGISDIDFRGLSDGTLYLILRNRFEKEISSFVPDLKKNFNQELEALKKDKRSLQGKLNNLVGKFAEYQLATDFRTRKRFPLSVYFDNVKDAAPLNIIDVKLRLKFQRSDGKDMEIDVFAESDCGRVVLVEVKKTKDKTGLNIVKDFQGKLDSCLLQKQFSGKNILPAFFSVGGFTEQAMQFCKSNGIGTAERIEYFFK